ncbi:hypothetical protein ZWY2020_044306 [Hordeum vulgare]|nr:hypothetical protein ZWY2020_044306 [Hordeum vulgare]
MVMVVDGASHEDEDAVEPEHDDARPEDEDAEYEYEEVVESDEHGEDDDGVTYEYEEMETEDNDQDDEAAAVAGLNDADVVEINANHQLPMVDVHPSSTKLRTRSPNSMRGGGHGGGRSVWMHA